MQSGKINRNTSLMRLLTVVRFAPRACSSNLCEMFAVNIYHNRVLASRGCTTDSFPRRLRPHLLFPECLQLRTRLQTKKVFVANVSVAFWAWGRGLKLFT
eukprot:3152122-Amphidinium_carterae.1